jgi:hypothetical protein
MNSKMREDFEAWVLSGSSPTPVPKFTNGDYHDEVVQAGWKGWQEACRQSGLVERIIQAINKEEDRLGEESYMMDSDDCVDVIRETVAAELRIKGDL